MMGTVVIQVEGREVVKQGRGFGGKGEIWFRGRAVVRRGRSKGGGGCGIHGGGRWSC